MLQNFRKSAPFGQNEKRRPSTWVDFLRSLRCVDAIGILWQSLSLVNREVHGRPNNAVQFYFHDLAVVQMEHDLPVPA